MTVLVDSKVLELARYFMHDVDGYTGQDVQDLAAAIQDVCEDRCKEVEEREGVRVKIDVCSLCNADKYTARISDGKTIWDNCLVPLCPIKTVARPVGVA